MTWSRRRTRLSLGALLLAVGAYLLVPPGAPRFLCYGGIAVGALALAAYGTRNPAHTDRSGWRLLTWGYLTLVLGDAAFTVEEEILRLATYPLPSDLLYLVAYLLLVAGVLRLARNGRAGRGRGSDVTVLLDALIVATGVGIVTVTFVVTPLVQRSNVSTPAWIVLASFPLADLLVLAILSRLWRTTAARSLAFGLLQTSALLILGADTVWSVQTISTGHSFASPWLDALWLLAYVVFAAAAVSPSAAAMSQVDGAGAAHDRSTGRLGWLAVGLLLPGLTLLVDGARGGTVSWQVLGVGYVVMSVLVLLRISWLFELVQRQSARLALLARSDALTGAPNRRMWDDVLENACAVGAARGTPVSVALLDLDRFKSYNDTHGHPAGDLLLQRAVAGWQRELGPGAVVARYGGEEFAVLFPGLTADAARDRLERLGPVTPGGQTFSAGVAQWDPRTAPASALAMADGALYRAKRSGRAQVATADSPSRPEAAEERS